MIILEMKIQKKIRQSIKKGINKKKLFEISNRENAIEQAIKDLLSGEVLVVAGKGHEKIQDYGSYKKKFSDKKYILKFIRKKNKLLKNDLKLNILNETSKNQDIYTKTKIRKGSINSKNIKKNDVFFAIKGKNRDGNKFVNEAFARGASLAIVNKINKSKKNNKKIKVLSFSFFVKKINK